MASFSPLASPASSVRKEAHGAAQAATATLARPRRGEHLRFKERHFLPYHGGHTIVFDQRPLYLQEEANASILENFSDYIARVD